MREGAVVDLRNEPFRDLIPLYLIKDMTTWRQRSIERINLSSALWVERQRHIQVKPLRTHILGAMQDHCGPSWKLDLPTRSHARLILPVGQFIKALRVDLKVVVDDKDVCPISRRDHIRLEVKDLAWWASRVRDANGISYDTWLRKNGDALETYLKSLFGFSPRFWNEFRTRKLNQWTYGEWDFTPISPYLNKNNRIPVATSDYWMAEYSRVKRLVLQNFPSNKVSATENPLLMIPDMFKQGLDVRQISFRLRRLRQFLEQAVNSSDEGNDLAYIYGLYGTYRYIFADCLVPLDRAFTIEVEEKRAFNFGDVLTRGTIDPERSSLVSPTVRLLVSYKEAESSHINVYVSDPNIELKAGSWRVRGERNEAVEQPYDVTQRRSAELFAIYSPNKQRPDRIWLTFRLRQTASIRFTLGVIWITLIATTIALVYLSSYRHVAMTALTGLLFPASIAASLLLTRGNTALGTRINRPWHVLTVVFMLFLIGVTILLFVCDP